VDETINENKNIEKLLFFDKKGWMYKKKANYLYRYCEGETKR
jgi:hypothetical protein